VLQWVRGMRALARGTGSTVAPRRPRGGLGRLGPARSDSTLPFPRLARGRRSPEARRGHSGSGPSPYPVVRSRAPRRDRFTRRPGQARFIPGGAGRTCSSGQRKRRRAEECTRQPVGPDDSPRDIASIAPASERLLDSMPVTASSFRANSPHAPASSIMTWLTSTADPKMATTITQNANGQLHVVTHVGEPPAAPPEVQPGPSGRQRTIPPGMTR